MSGQDNSVQQQLKDHESEIRLLKLANEQLMEENQALTVQMESVLHENAMRIEVPN